MSRPFVILEDNTATPAANARQRGENNNNPYILHPTPPNSQVPIDRFAHPTDMPFPVQFWMNTHHIPGQPFATPQQQAQAQTTQFAPMGNRVNVTLAPQQQGLIVNGTWHWGYLQDVYTQQQARPNPDVNAMWSVPALAHYDARYRQQNIMYPGTTWVSPAQGMHNNQQTLRQMEASGIHFRHITPDGYVQWL
jgi:hypothetical protein